MHGVLWTLVFVFVSFIFFSWGMKFTGSDRRDPNQLAKIGDEVVTYADFNKTYQPAVEKLYRIKDENPTSDEIKKLKEEVLDNLVDEAVLRQTALSLGLNVPDDELIGALQHQKSFLDDNGKFDKDKYLKTLEAYQFTPEQFENAQKEQMLLQKMRTVFDDSILFTNDDMKNYAVFLSRELKASYVIMDVAQYEKKISPSESDLKSYYQSNKNRYDTPERVKVRHVLISLQGSESLQDQEKAKNSLEDYRKQILSKKATFSEIAKKYSQDGGSKDNGGDLGWISADTMGPELKDFEAAVLKLKKGEISEPIKTKYGYHIAQASDRQSRYQSRFEEVRAKVLQQYQKEKAAQKIIALSEQLVEKLKNKETLDKAAADLGLSVSETTWFNRTTGIPSLKDSKEISEELSDLYSNDWKGPLSLGQKEIFFQVSETRESGKSDESIEKDTPDIARRLSSHRQEMWLKDFLAYQKKVLKVKTYLTNS